MNTEIKRQGKNIIVSTNTMLTQDEAARVAKRIEALLFITPNAKLIFVHSGKLELELKNYQVWETLLSCLNPKHVRAVAFVFERENAPFRFLAQEYARKATVPCFQHDNLSQLAIH